MPKLSIWIISVLSILAIKSPAADGVCDRILTHYNNLQVSRDQWPDGKCYVSMHPMNVKNMTYRDYLLTTDGLLMVFNSYGEGDETSSTGAREFYLFPRDLKVLEVIPHAEAQEVIVQFSSRIQVAFSTETAQIKSITGAQVSVDPQILSTNHGGVEIKAHQGLMLDIGFAMGHSPSANQQHESAFSDPQGQSCNIQNADLFNYSGSNSSFKLSDTEVNSLIQNRCPALKITP